MWIKKPVIPAGKRQPGANTVEIADAVKRSAAGPRLQKA